MAAVPGVRHRSSSPCRGADCCLFFNGAAAGWVKLVEKTTIPGSVRMFVFPSLCFKASPFSPLLFFYFVSSLSNLSQSVTELGIFPILGYDINIHKLFFKINHLLEYINLSN
jgi:hypothetical protein